MAYARLRAKSGAYNYNPAETVPPQTGFPLLLQQFKALFKKNFLLSLRRKKVIFLQIFSSFFLFLAVSCIQKALTYKYGDNTGSSVVYDPERLASHSIPPCEDGYFVKVPCFDFVWSGNENIKIQSIVDAIMKNNPERPIPSNKVKSFGTPDEVDAWFVSNPMRCAGALHFVQKNATVISYGIQTNTTRVSKRGMKEDITFKYQIPLQVAAEREIARFLLGDPNLTWIVGLKEFPHPPLISLASQDALGPVVFIAIFMFGFVSQVGSLVGEKELKLRQAMCLMGLYETSYWLSWLAWEAILTLLSSLFTVLFGRIFRFQLFMRHSLTVLFFLFYLFQLNMIGFAFMISTFVSKSSSATILAYAVFVVGIFTQSLTTPGIIFVDHIPILILVIWCFFPPNLLSLPLNLLIITYSVDEGGIGWHQRGKCLLPVDEECLVTMNLIYKWFIATFFLWVVLAIYFDNIFPDSSGLRKPLLYFLIPGYWTGKGANTDNEGGICSSKSSFPPLEEDTIPRDEDVLEEENIVKQQLNEGADDPNVAVQICGLVKTYPGTTPYHAIKGLWINIPVGELFCLLGPNGAGKTTTVSCLTGITPVSSGDALIYGNSVQSTFGITNIRKMMGVCPQHDTLWESLSAEEHLHLFASIKGVPPSSIESAVRNSLARVKLTGSAKGISGRLSGGMKRRLSLAIALIGDPKLLVLDEPTSGVDPITQRYVWDLIVDAKKGRAILLTTHSMEEADILSDRIGIMANGSLRCIGTSIRLKSRFGTGFVVNLTFHVRAPNVNRRYSRGTRDPRVEVVKQFFEQRLDVFPQKESDTVLAFAIPYEKEGLLTSFFTELQDRQEEFGISDIQVQLTTLEEVFLNIAKKAALET